MARNYKLTQTGQGVQDDLDKIEGAKIENGVITIGDVSITPLTEETDPTVHPWAKQPSKPTYTASEVGALPADTPVPSALSDLSDDSTHRTVTDAEKAAWDAKSDFSGAYDDLTGKPDLTQFVTKAVNDLVNYYTKSETYTRSQIQELIAAIQGVQFVPVATLPTASAETMGGKIYLVPSADPQAQNVKDEYITLDNGAGAQTRYTWEQIGSTAVNLSGYVTTADLNAALADYTTTANLMTLLSGKQDVISDLATIRSGAAAGATAYQKPASGIPSTDLADDVIPDVSGKQDIYSIPTAQITNPKEGDITVIAEEVKATDLQDSQTLSNISPNGGNILRIKQKSGSSLPSSPGKINIQGSYWGMFSGNLGSIEVRQMGGINMLFVVDASGEGHNITIATSYDLSALVQGGLAADSISLTEVIGDGEQSILPCVKIDSVKAEEVWEYKNGAWFNRRDFPTAFDTRPTVGSGNLIKSGGVAAGISDAKALLQSYSSDPASPVSPAREGDIWDSPLVDSLAYGDLIGSSYRYMPDSHYQTKIVISSETPEIYVTKEDDTVETITDNSVNPKFYPAGEVKYVGGYGFSGVYNYQPAFRKVYHNGSWVDVDTMFTDASGKADKVANAVSGNFAGLDSNGNLTDSGSKASDFLTSHQDISGKQNIYAVPTSQISSPKEGDISSTPEVTVVNNLQLIRDTEVSISPATHLKIVNTNYVQMVDGETKIYGTWFHGNYLLFTISVNSSSLQLLDANGNLLQSFAMGETYYFEIPRNYFGQMTTQIVLSDENVTAGRYSPASVCSISAVTLPQNKIYHSGSWVDIDTMFADPTALSNNDIDTIWTASMT